MALGIALVAVGLAVLGLASDRLVLYAGHLATRFKISPAIIGAVIVGFGTSAPEMAVSGWAAAQGDVDLGVGNIIGSNVANITLVLGLAALISPIPIRILQLYREFPACLVSVGVFALLVQGGLTWIEGLVLLVLLAVVLGMLVAQPGADGFEAEAGEIAQGTLRQEVLWVVLGIVGTVGGAQLLVEGAQRIAEELDLESGFVGLTVVAVGTSLPELVTAVAASRRGMNQLLVGNVLGSNIFNSLAVGGLVGVLGNSPLADASLTRLPIYILAGVTVWSFISALTRQQINRWESAVLVVAWGASLPFII